MTRPVDRFEAGRLEANARSHKYDARLDPVADLIDSGDVAAWQALPQRLVDLASIYRDFRQSYRDAVRAGLVPDDRSGPSAA